MTIIVCEAIEAILTSTVYALNRIQCERMRFTPEMKSLRLPSNTARGSGSSMLDESGIARLVEAFYDRPLCNPIIGPVFERQAAAQLISKAERIAASLTSGLFFEAGENARAAE